MSISELEGIVHKKKHKKRKEIGKILYIQKKRVKVRGYTKKISSVPRKKEIQAKGTI